MTDSYSRLIRRILTSAVLVIALLTFAFGFGNGWQLGLSLGVAGWIAPLVAPAVDLSVMALLASLSAPTNPKPKEPPCHETKSVSTKPTSPEPRDEIRGGGRPR